MRIGAGFWISLAGTLLGAALLFLSPLLGVQSWGARIPLTLLPPLLGFVLWLILRLLRMKQAMQANRESSPFESQAFESQLTAPWAESLRKETLAALEILRTSAKGKSGLGKNPLDIYRFYLVLGAEGSGKSSLLEHSGVHFPRRFPTTEQLARQTQHFSQWWFSNQGIFLEAPARYLGDDGDAELTQWLALLRREGKRVPLDAVLLVIGLEELLGNEDAAARLAALHRERLALILGTLRLELPLYLVFTHADMLPGYPEYFENLKEPDSHQVFGATLALKGSLAPVRDRFEREMRRIWEALFARIPYRLAQTEAPEKKQKVFAFPNEFGAAQERLSAFVENLFKDTTARERALFRGFFFTSIVPSGGGEETAEALFAGEAAAFHPLDVRNKMRAPPPAPLGGKGGGASGSTRALFLQLLFGGVLKSDRSLAQIPGYHLGSLSRRALIGAVGMAVLGLGLLLYGVVGYAESSSRLRRLATASEIAARIRWNNTGSFDREFAAFSALAGQLDSLAGGQNDSWLIPPGFGHAAEAGERAGRLHSLLLERLALRSAVRSLSASLEMASKYFNPADHGALRESLRLYLLLTSDGKPHLEDVDAGELAGALRPIAAQEILHKIGVGNAPPGLEGALDPHLLLWTGRFLRGERPALERTNQTVVQAVRAALLGNPSIEGLYGSIVAAEDPDRDLTLQAMGVPADAILKSGGKVRGFYTKDAFDGGALDRLAEGAEQPHRQDWVLGDRAAATLPPEMQDKRKLANALTDRYFEEYAAEWLRFLQSLSVRVPADPAQASGKLAGFASANQGLPVVLNRLLAETDLFAAPTAAGSELQKKMKESKFNKLAQMAMAARDADKKALKEKFRFVGELNGTGGSAGVLQEYFNSVRGLSEVLNRIALSGDGSAENLGAAQQLFQGKADNPLNLAWMEASKVRTRYETQAWVGPLLEGPVRDVASNLVETAAGNLDALYQSKVLPFYNQNLKGRYPIARNATLDVNVEDLKAFFTPENGVFPSFLNGKMGPFLRPSDEGLALATWNGIRLPMSAAALSALARAQLVGRRAAGDVPGAMKVHNLNLTLAESRNTKRVTLRLGEDKVSVAAGEGQGRQTLRWPSETSYKGAEMTVETPGGAPQSRRAEGSFALLKLLDGARALNLRPGGFSAKWRFTVSGKYDVDVALDANLADRENPFSTPDFFKFELPAKLMSGTGP